MIEIKIKRVIYDVCNEPCVLNDKFITSIIMRILKEKMISIHIILLCGLRKSNNGGVM